MGIVLIGENHLTPLLITKIEPQKTNNKPRQIFEVCRG